MLGPVLTGSRLRLEPPRPEHLPSYPRWFADTAVTAYLKRQAVPSLKEEEEWLERMARSETDVVWALVLADGSHVGSVGIHRIDWQSRHGTTGTLIGERSAWGQGYATEAMRLRTRYAFEDLGLEKLVTNVWLENEASRRALERVGYRQAGVHRRHVYRHGRWHDVWIGELLCDEWQTASKPEPAQG